MVRIWFWYLNWTHTTMWKVCIQILPSHLSNNFLHHVYPGCCYATWTQKVPLRKLTPNKLFQGMNQGPNRLGLIHWDSVAFTFSVKSMLHVNHHQVSIVQARELVWPWHWACFLWPQCLDLLSNVTPNFSIQGKSVSSEYFGGLGHSIQINFKPLWHSNSGLHNIWWLILKTWVVSEGVYMIYDRIVR